MRLPSHAVLLRLPRLDPRRPQLVVVHHLLEPRRQLASAAALQLVCRRRQIGVTKHRRHRARRPQRALQARHQRLKRLAQRQPHIRSLAVAEQPLEQQVRETRTPRIVTAKSLPSVKSNAASRAARAPAQSRPRGPDRTAYASRGPAAVGCFGRRSDWLERHEVGDHREGFDRCAPVFGAAFCHGRAARTERGSNAARSPASSS